MTVKCVLVLVFVSLVAMTISVLVTDQHAGASLCEVAR